MRRCLRRLAYLCRSRAVLLRLIGSNGSTSRAGEFVNSTCLVYGWSRYVTLITSITNVIEFSPWSVLV